jgi:TldD protein
MLGLTPNEAALRLGLFAGDEQLMRQIATWALDAAKAAGAKFADVRITFSGGILLDTNKQTNRVISYGPQVSSGASVGIRAVTDGVWGFAGQSVLTQEGIVALAKLAVSRARAGRPVVSKAFEFVDAPVVKAGKWSSPFEVDPMTIEFKDLEAFQLDAHEAVVKKSDAIQSAFCRTAYGREDSFFASSEGSDIYQTTITAGTGGSVGMKSKKDPERWVFTGTDIPGGQYGYEAISKSNLKGKWLEAVDECLKLTEIPWKSVEVGRYPIVFGKAAMANFVLATIGGALRLNRVRGDLDNSAGTSYAGPPADILGKYKVGSPMLTVTADRTRQRAFGTAGYDSDGVKTEEWSVVKEGIIVDYLTSRDTAADLASYYQSKGMPLKSHGCMVGDGINQPMLGYSNLTIQPGRRAANDEDLLKDVKKGFYVQSGGAGGDQQLINFAGYAGQVYEIVNGKKVGFAGDFGMQFTTQRFWAKLDALGGPESAGLIQIVPPGVGVFAVPGRVSEVNVVNTGKES